jgi:hypothetical protein
MPTIEEIMDRIDAGQNIWTGGNESRFKFDYSAYGGRPETAPSVVNDTANAAPAVQTEPAPLLFRHAEPPAAVPVPRTQMEVAAEAAADIVMPVGQTSIPVWTTQICGVYFTVILVQVPGCRKQYQIYAIDQDRYWTMVGLVGLYADALAELQSWSQWLGQGGTLAQWQKAHPDGIEPLFR